MKFHTYIITIPFRMVFGILPFVPNAEILMAARSFMSILILISLT